MFKLSEIRELIKLIDQTAIHELEIENEGFRLAIRKPGKPELAVSHAPAPHMPVVPMPAVLPAAPAAASAVAPAAAEQPAAQPAESVPAPAAANESLHAITSPMVGTFYAAPSPTSPPYVKKGDKVTPKTVVCIVEAMKLMNEIEAEVKGEIVEVLVENGQLVEYGQPLFLVRLE